jgi:hypothetical protein
MEANSDGMGCRHIKGGMAFGLAFGSGWALKRMGMRYKESLKAAFSISSCSFSNYAMPLPSMPSIQIPLSKAKHQP